MTCLTENVVVELVEGLLVPLERDRAHAHLHECKACRELVSAVARLAGQAASTASPAADLAGGVSTAETDWLPRGTTIDRYVVLEQVGVGSAGTVYAAYDPDLDRRVALKLLRTASPGGSADDAVDRRAALLREARVMARLSHPNIITVHDAGTTDSGLFVAMEFVSGYTLREWCELRERSWSEIRRVFVAAGRGLAAAHRAGLAHRDFKPDNVLIGRDGAVRVTDFGLARLLGPGEASPPEQDGDDEAAPEIAASPDAWRLSRTGALIGTPAYMAPEQHLGRAANAASDQFSFCVALYEAAYRQRPFEGRSLDELREAVTGGRPQAPPAAARRGVPAAAARALERGMAVDPAARFPSMSALLDELTGRRPRRWIAAAAAAALAAILGLGAALWSRDADPSAALCTGAADHLAAVWSPDRERAVHGSFAATRLAYASAAATRVSRVIDGYADRWIADHTAACRATRVLGEQSEAALDLRMGCLTSRRRELAALVDVLAAADATVVEGAIQASHALRPSSDCADLEALADPVPRPSDPAAAARLDALEIEVARASAQGETGHWREALVATRAVATKARELGHAPLLAEVLIDLANLENVTGEPAAAERTLEEAVLAAEAGRADALRARALILAAQVIASPKRVEEGQELVEHAAAIAGRLHDRRVNAALARASGNLAFVGARIQEARRHFERALAEEEAAFGPDHPRLTRPLNDLGEVLERLAEYDLAERHLVRARDLAEKALGPDHPLTASAHAELASLATSRGRADEALRLYDRVIDIRMRALGEKNVVTPRAIYQRAEVLMSVKRLDEAQAEMERALRMARALPSPNQQLVAALLEGLAKVLSDRGQNREALALGREALAIERSQGDRRNVAPTLYALGTILLRERRFREALAHLDEAMQIWESFLGPEHPHLAFALDEIGNAHIDMGKLARAVAPLERSRRIRTRASITSSPWGADNAFALGRTLWRLRRDRARAIQLVREAAAFWRTSPAHTRELASAEAWLTRNGAARSPGSARSPRSPRAAAPR